MRKLDNHDLAVSEKLRLLLDDYRKATRDMGLAMINFQEVHEDGETSDEIQLARINAQELLAIWLMTSKALLEALD